jgi:hypothetical protein
MKDEVPPVHPPYQPPPRVDHSRVRSRFQQPFRVVSVCLVRTPHPEPPPLPPNAASGLRISLRRRGPRPVRLLSDPLGRAADPPANTLQLVCQCQTRLRFVCMTVHHDRMYRSSVSVHATVLAHVCAYPCLGKYSPHYPRGCGTVAARPGRLAVLRRRLRATHGRIVARPLETRSDAECKETVLQAHSQANAGLYAGCGTASTTRSPPPPQPPLTVVVSP